MFINFTWKRQGLFTFTGGVLNTKNVSADSIFADIDMKHNNSEKKGLFLIYEGVNMVMGHGYQG